MSEQLPSKTPHSPGPLQPAKDVVHSLWQGIKNLWLLDERIHDIRESIRDNFATIHNEFGRTQRDIYEIQGEIAKLQQITSRLTAKVEELEKRVGGELDKRFADFEMRIKAEIKLDFNERLNHRIRADPWCSKR